MNSTLPKLKYTTQDGTDLKTSKELRDNCCKGCYFRKKWPEGDCQRGLSEPQCPTGCNVLGSKFIWTIDGPGPYEPTPVLTKLTNLLKWVTGI